MINKAIESMASEAFANHVAIRSTGSDHIGEFTTLEWVNPGRTMYGMVFMLRDGILLVSGDCGYAIYRWTGIHPIEWFFELDLDYFSGKKITDKVRSGKSDPAAQWHYHGLTAALKYLAKKERVA